MIMSEINYSASNPSTTGNVAVIGRRWVGVVSNVTSITPVIVARVQHWILYTTNDTQHYFSTFTDCMPEYIPRGKKITKSVVAVVENL